MTGGGGTFHNFQSAVLNDAGRIAFLGNALGQDGGFFLTDSAGGVISVARVGDPAPGGGAIQYLFNYPALNEAGQIPVPATTFGSASPNDHSLFLFDSAGPVGSIVEHGDPAPDGNGVFYRPPSSQHTLNDAGELAFSAAIDLQDGGSSFDEYGIYRGDSSGAPVQLARTGDAPPDGNGTFSTFGASTSVNSSGQVAFDAQLTGTSGGSADARGVYISDGTLGNLVQVVREGDPAVDGNGTFFFVTAGMLNDSGQMLLGARYANTSGGTNDDRALFLGDVNGPIQLAREGDVVPGGNGAFSDFQPSMLNNNGQVIFIGQMTGTTSGAFNDSALFVSDDMPGTVSEIVREGDPAPDGNGVFSTFSYPAFNDAGQAAFVATLRSTSGGSNDNHALYFYDPVQGLSTVTRQGDPLLGSTVTSVSDFSSGVGLGDEYSGLNELGQVATRVALADGNEAIILWSAVPEPTSIALGLLGMGASGLVVRRRR